MSLEAGLEVLGDLVSMARMVVGEAPLRGMQAAEYTRLLRRINVDYVPPQKIPASMKFRVFRDLIEREGLDYVINRLTLQAVYIGFELEDLDELQRALAYLHALGAARARVKQRMIACPRCGSTRVLTQLVCPNCGSRLLRRTRLIHHKPCGYIGREDEFEEAAVKRGAGGEGGLLCPRCGMPLHTMGVDYEVVGEAFVCEVCGTLTRKPGIAFNCVACGNDFGVEGASYKGLLAAEPTERGLKAWRLSALETALFVEEMRKRGVESVEIPARLRLAPPPGSPPSMGKTVEALARISAGGEGSRAAAHVTLDTLRRYGDLDAFISGTLTWFLFNSLRGPGRCAFILLADTGSEKVAQMISRHGVVHSLAGQVRVLGRELIVAHEGMVDDKLLGRISTSNGVGVVLVVDVSGSFEKVRDNIAKAADLASAVLGLA